MRREVKIHQRNQIRLSDLKLGEIAVSNAGKAYTKICVPNRKEHQELLIELTDLSGQYFDCIDIHFMVKVLDQPGEGISIINASNKTKQNKCACGRILEPIAICPSCCEVKSKEEGK